MTRPPMDSAKPSLGMAHVIGWSVVLLLRNLPRIFLICAPVIALSFAALEYVWRSEADIGNPFRYLSPPDFWPYLAWMLGDAIGQAVVSALVVHVAVAASTGQRPNLRAAMKTRPGSVPPIAALAMIYMVLGALSDYGLTQLTVIWPILVMILIILLDMTLFVAAPCIVVERLGLRRAVRRSLSLTRGYRWSIFGLVVLTYVFAILLIAPAYILVSYRFQNLIDAFGIYTFTAVGTLISTLAYLRLGDLKDGAPPQELAKVFA